MEIKSVLMNRMVVEPNEESIINIKHNHNQDAFVFSTYKFENKSWSEIFFFPIYKT